jgi:hypothetical protein
MEVKYGSLMEDLKDLFVKEILIKEIILGLKFQK